MKSNYKIASYLSLSCFTLYFVIPSNWILQDVRIMAGRKRKFELVNAPERFDTDSRPTITKTDWERCLICQSESSEKLVCPANSTRKDKHAGYQSLVDDILRYSTIGQMPCNLDTSRLREDQQDEFTTFVQKRAKYHKSCRNKFDLHHFNRAQSTTDKDTKVPLVSASAKSIGTRSSYKSKNFQDKLCFFCELDDTNESLHLATTFQLNSNVKKAAIELQDTKLIAKLSEGDMVAIEAKYHRSCLVALYNRQRRIHRKLDQPDDDKSLIHGIVLSQIIEYIKMLFETADVAPVFKMSNLVSLYCKRLHHYGIEVIKRDVHSTRLKDNILKHIPELEEQKLSSHDVYLSFKKDTAKAVFTACHNSEDDGMVLFHAANVIRKELFKSFPCFDGSFYEGCKEDSVPNMLLTFVRMILEGGNIESANLQSEDNSNEAALSISQLIRFNALKGKRSAEANSQKHSLERETPLPLYTGLMLYKETRKKKLITKLASMGLSVSYDRVQSIQSSVAENLCKMFEELDTVVPLRLAKEKFTLTAIDNIDQNAKSSTAKSHFHGTGISMFQFVNNSDVIERPRAIITADKTKCKLSLPSYYTEVQPRSEEKSMQPLPLTNTTEYITTMNVVDESQKWLENVDVIFSKEEEAMQDIGPVSWSAFYSRNMLGAPLLPCINSILPLLFESINSKAAVAHLLKVITRTLQFINPEQTPVITADQPVYANAKQIQWQDPKSFGEEKMIILMGDLHIEMAVMDMIGDWLEGSEWCDVFVAGEISTPGTSQSYLSGHNVKRCR